MLKLPRPSVRCAKRVLYRGTRRLLVMAFGETSSGIKFCKQKRLVLLALTSFGGTRFQTRHINTQLGLGTSYQSPQWGVATAWIRLEARCVERERGCNYSIVCICLAIYLLLNRDKRHKHEERNFSNGHEDEKIGTQKVDVWALPTWGGGGD